ncbi:MAG: hypothetical protein GXO43_06035 [Crenarchaeota archaeon]|nr:hypothetical protein [Thermoproteota archaeon]
MRFIHPRVIDYIFGEGSCGLVATMRNYRYRVGHSIRVRVGNKVFCGNVLAVVDNTRENAEKYVEYSGFNSVDEWLGEAIRLHHGRRPKYIVLVKLWDCGTNKR